MGRYTETEYRRYTAVLREDQRNYAITPTKRPRGKATIEVSGEKGVLKCSVKNLRFSHEGGSLLYGVWLVSQDVGQILPAAAGIIAIGEGGEGEGNWTLNAENVCNTGLEIDSFNTLEVRTILPTQERPGDRVLVGHLELEEVNFSEEPKMEKVAPFGKGLPFYQWWKFYPGFFNDWTYYPMQPVSQACSGDIGELQTGPVFQGHQLVGLQYDQKGAIKFLVHGIPGRFCLRDQPYGGMTGYVFWHPLPGQQYKAGDYGYWLIHIDPKNGEVVFPKKATKPPNCEECKRFD